MIKNVKLLVLISLAVFNINSGSFNRLLHKVRYEIVGIKLIRLHNQLFKHEQRLQLMYTGKTSKSENKKIQEAHEALNIKRQLISDELEYHCKMGNIQ